MNDHGNLPNLIIIGVMKSGTTSLHRYLNLHPDILMSRQKELKFFVDELNWNKGIEWYKSNFIGEAKIYGESSPSYTKYPIWRGVPERIFSVIPNTKWHINRVIYFPVSQEVERPILDQGLRQRLIDYLKNDIDSLRSYTGRDFNEWCV